MQHINDPFVKMATQKGYRARAAFKLTEILDAEKIMRRGDIIVDLGSTPGSWSQVARERLVGKGGVLDGRIIALDDDVASRWGPRLVELVIAIRDAVSAVLANS